MGLVRLHCSNLPQDTMLFGEPCDVRSVERYPHPGQLDHVMDDRHRLLDAEELTGEDELIPAEDDPDAEQLGHLLHVRVVDAGEEQVVRTFGVEPVLYDGLSVCHALPVGCDRSVAGIRGYRTSVTEPPYATPIGVSVRATRA